MSGPIVLALRLLLAVSLYLFLGWAFWSLWKEIRQQGSLLAGRKVPSLGLSIQEEGKPRHQQFASAEITIGRDLACEFTIENPTISARHARLSYHHNQWWLEDLHSTNGTRINGIPVAMPVVVISGDEISCGEVHLTVELAGALPAIRQEGANQGQP